MSLFNFLESKLGREYKLTFFCPLRNNEFVAALTPLGFKLSRDKSLSWVSDLKTVFTIKPFNSEGNESSGYVIHFEGDYRSLFQLINHSLKQINPEFVNIEMRLNDGYSQSENISIARNKGFQEASTLGIYSVDNIGIVLLPGGTAVVQARTKSLQISKLNVLLTAIDTLAANFKKEEVYDLFTSERLVI